MKPLLACIAAALLTGCSAKKPELHVFNWDDYFAPDTLSGFEKEAGCRVVLDTYSSDQDLIAKLVAGGSGYDVCFPSDEAVPALVEKRLLQKLDLAKIPNAKNVARDRLGLPFDSKNEWTLPYFWGTTGIAYNREKVSPPPSAWKDLWNEACRGRLSILDDARETLGAALRTNGRSINDTTPDALAAAKEKLVRLKPLLQGYDSAPKEKLIAGDVWVAQCFSGDAIQAKQSGAPIEYVIPSEGASLWVDSLAIPAGAPNVDLAHRFIDYLLRADVSAALANHIGYGSANEAARPLIKPEVLAEPAAYPPPDVLRRCEFLRPLTADEKKRIEDLWTEVKLR